MKVVGYRIIDGTKVPMIVECTGMEVAGQSGWVEKFDPENCRICLKSTHPTVSYFVIKCERQETAKYNIKPYKWLTKKEAEAIVEYAAVSDVVDLRKLGDYLIHCQKQIQSVIIMNDVDDFTDEERPILVKQVSDTKD